MALWVSRPSRNGSAARSKLGTSSLPRQALWSQGTAGREAGTLCSPGTGARIVSPIPFLRCGLLWFCVVSSKNGWSCSLPLSPLHLRVFKSKPRLGLFCCSLGWRGGQQSADPAGPLLVAPAHTLPCLPFLLMRQSFTHYVSCFLIYLKGTLSH